MPVEVDGYKLSALLGDEDVRPVTAVHPPKKRPGKKGDPVAVFLKSCTAKMPEAETPATSSLLMIFLSVRCRELP